LHLAKAQKGLWNLGDDRELHYKNLGGDYLDAWMLLENSQPFKYLYAPSGYLIYQDGSGVQFFQVDVPPALFTTVPPRDRSEWEELNAKLDEHQVDYAPDDLLAMAEQFGEPSLAISKASIRDFRLTEGGFRFVLDLQPGFAVSGSGRPDLSGMSAGAYALHYEDRFDILPLTPARPNLVAGTLRPSDPAPVALEPVYIEATLQNQGLEDAPELYVRAHAGETGGQRELVAEKEIALLAGDSVPLRFEWIPPAPGKWRVSLEWGLATDGEPAPQPGQAVATLDVKVASPPPLHAAEIWRISNARPPSALLLLLTTVALAASSIFFLGMRRVRRRS
jgi:hypothetical protein